MPISRCDGGMPRRIIQLLAGLALYGAGCALTITAGLGVDPWTVLAEGVSNQTGIGVGWVTNLLGAAVLLAWIPLRQYPGIGTLVNIALVGTSMQIALSFVPAPETPLDRKSVVSGKSVSVRVDVGGSRILNNKKHHTINNKHIIPENN